MLTAKLTVEYEGDWTSDLGRYDVSGEFLASTFRDRRYFGLLALEADEDEFAAVIETVRDHESTTSVDVIEQYSIGGVDRVSATLLHQEPPLRVHPAPGAAPRGVHPARGLRRTAGRGRIVRPAPGEP